MANGKLISFTTIGDWNRTTKFLDYISHLRIDRILERYADEGLLLLSEATFVRTGLASKSWYYTIHRDSNGASITYRNSDIEGGCNVIILLQYGHATKNGGYIRGIDFVNPAIQPTFDKLVNKLWKEVVES